MSQSAPYSDGQGPTSRPVTIWARAGIALMVTSLLLWVPVPVVPFLDMSAVQKASLGDGGRFPLAPSSTRGRWDSTTEWP